MKLPLTFITKVLFNFAYAQFGAAFQKVNYGKYPKAVQYANIRGFKMNYEFYGKVEPLLLIHSNTGSIKPFSIQKQWRISSKNLSE